MNKGILLFACMAWIKCTTSYQTLHGDPYTRSMRNALVGRSRPLAINLGCPSNFDIHNGDKITIHKVIDGRFAANDIVYGNLQRVNIHDYDRALGDPPMIDGQHGEVEITLGDLSNLLQAPLQRNPGHQDHGRNTGPVEYFCTIERDEHIFLAAVLRRPSELRVPFSVPRALFVNHLYPNPSNTSFTGELFPATPTDVGELLSTLGA